MRRQLVTCYLLLITCCIAAKGPFALGADIGWNTEYEAQGKNFYLNTADRDKGKATECTELMKQLGMNAVRIRVWVDPKEHGNWCDKNDVLVKALRAKKLGMDIMIDFHYSDWWADPGKQPIPTAWKDHSYEQVKKDVAEHTIDVLTLLKKNGVTPKWVQVGNEASNGFMWPMAKLDWKDANAESNKHYAGLFKAGYDAVKMVFPDVLVIAHLDNGWNKNLYRYNLDILVNNGAVFDMVGMSIYPFWTLQGGDGGGANASNGYKGDAYTVINDCIDNINYVYDRYGKDVMIVETGFEVNEQKPETMEQGREQYALLISKCKNDTHGHCKGVFYWEPECRPSQYKLGAFHEDGTPTIIMDALKNYK